MVFGSILHLASTSLPGRTPRLRLMLDTSAHAVGAERDRADTALSWKSGQASR